MFRKDFLQKQFEEFGKVLAMILMLRKERRWDAYMSEINNALTRFTPYELESVESLDEASFLREVVENEKVPLSQKKFLASLLFEKLNYYAETGDKAGFEKLRDRCLRLYLFLQENHTNNEFDLDVHYKLALLKEMQ